MCFVLQNAILIFILQELHSVLINIKDKIKDNKTHGVMLMFSKMLDWYGRDSIFSITV